MAVVTHQVKLPDGSFPAFFVAIQLVASVSGDAEGHVPSLDYSIGGVSRPVVTAGAWQADLTPNALVVPAGTVYQVVESLPGGTVVSYITVPSAGGRLEDLLTVSPVALPSPVPPSVGGGGLTVIQGGALGSSYTLALVATQEKVLVGTLTADLAVTVSLAAGGRARLMLTQDASPRAVSVNGVPVAIPSAAGAVFDVSLFSDGTDLYVETVGASGPQGLPGTAGAVGAASTVPGPAGPAGPGQYAPTAGEETIDRATASGFVTLSTGFMRVVYFKARSSETITKLLLTSATTAAAATPTLVRAGIYTVAADWSLTLAASIANDPTIFAAASTEYLRALTSPLTKTAGSWYAVGLLVVTAVGAPTVPGVALTSSALSGSTQNRPRVATFASGQTDLPASASAASLGATPYVPYALLVP